MQFTRYGNILTAETQNSNYVVWQHHNITDLRKCQYQKERGEIVGNAVLTPFGKAIKKHLIDMGRTQTWLIEQVTRETGLYFDSSYMYKIQTGQLSTPKIVQAIREILDLPEQEQGAS